MADSPNALSWMLVRCDALVERLDSFVASLQRRAGAWGASLVLAVILMLAAAVYTAPAKDLINHGILYGEFSRDPIQQSLTSPLALRPLSPVVAHVLFLRGRAFMVFPLLAGVAFLALIVRASLRRGLSGAESLAMASLMAFTSPVLFTLHFAGYVDLVSYLLIGVAMVGAASDLVVAGIIVLLLLNHDANLFILPWLLFHTARQRGSWARRTRLLLAVGAGLLVVTLVRAAIMQRAPTRWEPGFYLNVAYLRENALLNVRGAWLGVFMAFKLVWVVPLFAALDLAVRKKHMQLVDLGMVVGGGLATLLISSDESRMPAMAFPGVLAGALVLRKSVLRPPSFARAVWALVLVNLLVPQYYVGQSKPVAFYSLPVALALKGLGYDPWQDWLGLRQMRFSQE